MENIKFEPPLIIDYHSHLNVPGSEKWAKIQHIDRTVLLSGSQDDNQCVMDFCKDKGGRFIPFCRLDLDNVEEAVCEVRKLAKQGFKGVKFQPLVQRFLPDERRLYPLWAAIEELGLPITSHAGTVAFGGHAANFANPSGWSQIALDFPNLNIVIAHMGGDFSFQALVMAEIHPNIYLDTAHLSFFCARMLPQVEPVKVVERAIRFAGAKKVLFASEGMTPDLIWNSSNISTEDRKCIFWKNALKLLNEQEI